MSNAPGHRRRVLVVMLPIGRGGAVRSTQILLEALLAGGTDTALAVVDGRVIGNLRGQMPAGVAMYDLGWRSRLHLPLAIWQLARLLRHWRPDIAIGVNTYSALTLLAAAGLGRYRRPTIVRELIDPRLIRGTALSRLKLAVARFLYRRATLVMTASAGMGAAVAARFRLPASKVRHIPNGYDPTLDEPSPTSDPPDDWLDGGRPTLVYVGRLVPIKGVQVLIEALGQLRTRGVAARLLVIGEGPDQPRLEGLAADAGLAGAIRFTGYVDRPYHYMAAASAVVVPSLSEGFGNVIVEAMRAGGLVVASDCDYGPREIITERSGILVPPGDPAALASAIERVLAEPDYAAGLRRGALARAADFAPTRMVERWLALFDELVPG